MGKIQSILCFDSSPDYLHSFKRWEEQAVKEAPVPSSHIKPEDAIVLIYTSGTTGTQLRVTISKTTLWRDRTYESEILCNGVGVGVGVGVCVGVVFLRQEILRASR